MSPVTGARQPRPQPVKQHFCLLGQTLSSLHLFSHGANVCSTVLLGQVPGLAGTARAHCTRHPRLQHLLPAPHLLSLLHCTRQIVTLPGLIFGQYPGFTPMGSLHSLPQPLLQQRSDPGQSASVEQKLLQFAAPALMGAGHSPLFTVLTAERCAA